MQDRVTITMLEDGVADVRLARTDKMNAPDHARFAGSAQAVAQPGHPQGRRAVGLSG